VNAGDALAAAHERDERRLPRLDFFLTGRRLGRLAVEEAARGVGEDQRDLLF